jgi:hypothetical protein
MKTWIVRTGIAVALLLVGYLVGHHSVAVVHAQEPITVPKSWGHCIGAASLYAMFEDDAGTIHFVDVNTGIVKALIVRK